MAKEFWEDDAPAEASVPAESGGDFWLSDQPAEQMGAATDTGDETQRLAARYPAPSSSVADTRATEAEQPARFVRTEAVEPVANEKPVSVLQTVGMDSSKPWSFADASRARRAIDDMPQRRPEASITETPLATQIGMDARKSVTNPAARGVMAGFAGLGQVVPGAVQAGADLVGADGVADAAGRVARTGQQLSAPLAPAGGTDKLVFDIANSITQTAPTLIVGLGGGPAMTALFSQSAAQEYTAGRSAGLDGGTAAARAGIMASAEVVGERFGFGEQLRILKGLAGRVPVEELAPVFARQIMKEVPGEQLTTLVQFLGDKYGPGAQNSEAALAAYLQQAGETLKVTIGQSAVMGGGPVAISAVRKQFERPVDRTPQIEALRKAGDETAASLLEQRQQKDQAAYSTEREAEALAQINPDLAQRYRDVRLAGAKTGDAVVQTAARWNFEQAAQMAGLSPKAQEAIAAKLAEVPPEKAAAFVQKAVTGLVNAGMAQPFDGMDTLAQTIETQRDQMLDSVLGAMSAIEQLEAQQDAAQDTTAIPEAAAQAVDTGATAPDQLGNDPALGGTEPGDALSDINDVQVTPELDAVHAAATSPLNDLPEPTEAQKKAGNYKVGRIRMSGMDISIENPQGSERRGVAPDGKEWTTPMRDHYGYFKGTTAADGDKLDVFIKPGTPQDYDGTVFVVDQINPSTGKFDEAKVVFGAVDQAEAEAIYRRNYSADWKGFGAITQLPMPAFKAWAKSNATRNPLGVLPAADVQNAPQQPAGTQAQAAPVEARAPAGGDAAAAAGIPAETGAGDVQADGVKLKDGAQITISQQPAPKAFGSLVRGQFGEPTALIATNEAGEEVGRLTFMPNGGPIDSFVREQDRRRGVGTALYDALEARGGKLPPVSSGMAISEDARALRKAREGAIESLTDRPDGTLAVKGDTKALRERLTAAGIPARSILPSAAGVVVGKTQAQKARTLLTPPEQALAQAQTIAEPVPKLSAREAQAEGEKAREAAKKEKRKAAKPSQPSGLRVGITPASAEPVTVRDGVVFIGESEAIDFESGDSVKIKDGASNDEVVAALKAAGALSRRQKVFSQGSATGNDGTFDTQNPDVRFAVDDAGNAGDTAAHGQPDTRPEARINLELLGRDIAAFLKVPQREFDAVRPYDARVLPGAADLQRIADAFGSEVQGFGMRVGLDEAAREQYGFFGGVRTSGVLFLRDQGSDRPHLAVLGHELAHELRSKQPKLYDQLVDAITPYVDVAKNQTKTDKQQEEFMGEVLSDGFMDPDFWRALGRKNPSLLQHVGDFVFDMIEKAMKVLGYTKRSAPYLTDYKAVMRIAGEVMAEYGVTPRGARGDMAFSRPLTAELFRQMTTPMQRGMKTTDLQKAIAPVLKRWENGPNVTVGATTKDLPMPAPGDVHGVYFGGNVYLVAQNIRDKSNAMKVLAHEAIAHHGLREMLGKDDWKRFMGNIQLALKTGNKPLAAIRKDVRAAYVDDAGKFNLSEMQEADEIAAKVVEQAVDADGNFRPGFGFVKSVYAKVVEFLRSIGIDVKMTHAELQGALVNAQRFLEVGKKADGARNAQEPVYMRSDAKIQPSSETLAALREKHGDLESAFQAATGYGFDALTESEARYLANFKPAESVRDRILAEGRNRGERKDQGTVGGVAFSRTAKVPASIEAEKATGATKPAQAEMFQPGFWDVLQETRLDDVIYELQDGRIDLKRVQETIAKANAIPEKFDARLAETLYPGRVATRSERFLNDEAKPLLEAMARNNVTMDELADYLHARHAEERNKQIAKVNPDLPDGGAGKNSKGVLMTTAAAKAHMAGLSDSKRMVLDAMAKRVDTITAGTSKLLVDEGLEKQETIDAWNGAYQKYVPLFRDEAENGNPHPTGGGMSVRGSSSKRAVGSTKKATNILAHVLMQREAAITRAEKNRVAVALYGLALTNPNPDFWTTIRPGMSPEAIGQELQRMGVDPTVAEAGMQGVPTIKTVDPVLGRVVSRPNPIYKSLPGAIVLKVNGEDRVLMVNVNDPRGLRMAENLKNLDGLTKLDIAGSLIGKLTRWMASVNTQYNPAFGLVNLTRDTLGGAINLSSTKLRGKTLKVLALTPGALKGIGLELSGKDSGEWGRLFRQFQADGGQTGYREQFKDANDRAKKLEAELKALEKAGKLTADKVAGKVLGALDIFNTTLENAVRLAAYREALLEGMSRPEAARLGRELTVDFNRKGRMGRELGPLYAFFNASVQGQARTLQTLAGPAGAKIIAGGVSLGVLQAIMLLAAGYDDDEIPEFVKTRAFIIPLGKNEDGEKKYLTIPLPLGLHVLPNTGRVLTELTLDGGKDVGSKLFSAVGEIAGAFNPLGGGNVFTADGALRTVAPTVVDPIIELGFNKNFAGAPIEREGYGNDPRPGFERAREGTLRTSTGQAYLEISRILNKVSGGDEFEAGKISPTPERVRYLAQVVGGGLLREVEKMVNTSVDLAKGNETKSTGYPVFGRFYGQTDDASVQRGRYYDNLAAIEKAEKLIKAAEKKGDLDAADRIEQARPEAELKKEKNRAVRDLRELNNEAMATVGDHEAMKQLDEERTEVMRELNQYAAEVDQPRKDATLGAKVRQGMADMLP